MKVLLKNSPPPKTTDDCYTPSVVYDEVVDYVNEKIMRLEGVKIVRPFYPGGDYEHFNYPEGAVVIDNPPFSIISKICKFYCSRGIRYFLFAPALTLFSSPVDGETFILANATIVYHNGAKVPTSFRTNMIKGGIKVRLAGDLHKRIAECQPKIDKSRKSIIWPDNLITGALLGRLAVRGICLDFPEEHVSFVRRLDNCKSSLYGNGFLISEECAEKRRNAEKEAAERAIKDHEAALLKAKNREAIRLNNAEIVLLSDKEKNIIKSLGNSGRH